MTDPPCIQPFESRQAIKSFILQSIEGITVLLRTVNHPKRIEILAILLDGSKDFKILAEITDFPKSALSNHLSILMDRNLVEKKERGMYNLTIDGEELISKIAKSYLDTKIREQERLMQLQKLIGRYTTYIEDQNMSKEEKFEPRIVELEPMHVASARVISESPEQDTWAKLSAWAEKKGLLDNHELHPVFGFNNPDPSPDKKDYGYEFWIKVDPETESEGDITVKGFEGGLYAVTTTKLFPLGEDECIPAWKKLGDWVKESKYDFGKHQWMEKHLNPRASPEELVIDLHMPIKEKK